MNLENFYNLLFNPGEGVCWSSTPFGTKVSRFEDWEWAHSANQLFFCINPLRIGADRSPTQSWHSANVGRRADANVTEYRTILCEFDNLPLEQQYEYIKECGVPYSALTYSGGKSLHLLIRLDTPCSSKEEYVALVKRVHNKLRFVDTSTSNPSRFSRVPCATRENGKRQDLIEVKSKVYKLDLNLWLGPESDAQIAMRSNTIRFSNEIDGKRILFGKTKKFLDYGAEPGQWNSTLFIAVCDMRRSGYDKYEITEMCSKITGYLDNRDLATIDSACSSVERDMKCTSSD